MSATLIYRQAFIYEAAMWALYGRHYGARYSTIADLIPPDSKVLDLCCGPGTLFDRYLRRKRVDYTGLDISESFIRRLRQRGGKGLVWDLQRDIELPKSKYVVMQASLYGFLPNARPMFERMMRAAQNGVIVSEPIRNLASSSNPVIAAMSKRLTDAGDHRSDHRFTEQTLDEFFSPYKSSIDQVFRIPGGREKVFVFKTDRAGDSRHANVSG